MSCASFWADFFSPESCYIFCPHYITVGLLLSHTFLKLFRLNGQPCKNMYCLSYFTIITCLTNSLCLNLMLEEMLTFLPFCVNTFLASSCHCRKQYILGLFINVSQYVCHNVMLCHEYLCQFYIVYRFLHFPECVLFYYS